MRGKGWFSSSTARHGVESAAGLPAREEARYERGSMEHMHSAFFPRAPKNILLVAKRTGDEKTHAHTRTLATHLHDKYAANIVVEPHLALGLSARVPFTIYVCDAQDTIASHAAPHELQTSLSEIPFGRRRRVANGMYESKIDAVVTLGGDGTILHAASLFSFSASPPPILSFSMGSLGFLTPWYFHEHERALEHLMTSRAEVMFRSRLVAERRDEETERTIHLGNAMNEINLHRGSSPHLTVMDISMDGRHLTRCIADGMVVSTPTGSTAYSLSSGGSIVHPLVESILVTPICPRSLSFRPLVLPFSSTFHLRQPAEARKSAELSIDGKERGVLTTANMLTIQRAAHGIPCIMRGEDAWNHDLNRLLGFNRRFEGRNASHLDDDEFN